MAGKFMFKKFSEICSEDSFFDSLKADYPGNQHSTGFAEWFQKKASSDATALVFNDEQGLGAFTYLKKENEPIVLSNQELPAIERIKIGTLRLADRYRGQRLGEGAMGLSLWRWQKSGVSEIYATVFEKHQQLISLFERFGFDLVGTNKNGERVYIKSRCELDYSDPYKSFPYINPNFQKSGYLIVDDEYHDELFPYSELKGTLQQQVGLAVANGISKIYVGKQYTKPHYQAGEPILIYRKHTGDGTKRYKSCVTSFCIVSDVIMAKSSNHYLITFDDLISRIGNKSVFNVDELRNRYDNDNNVVVIEMLYFGFFGEGNNVNMDWLDKNNCWGQQYPATIELTPEQFRAILEEGKVDVSNVIIN